MLISTFLSMRAAPRRGREPGAADCLIGRARSKLRPGEGPLSGAAKFQSDGIREASDLAAPIDPIVARIFAYWDGKRAGRPMPSRADIDPTELRGLVNHVMIYDVVEPGRLYRIRLVGEAIVEFVGVTHAGKWAHEPLPPGAAERMVEILTSVVAGRAPRFRAGLAYWHVAKAYRHFEACFLPLSSDGETVDKILSGHFFATDR
jgi:PAS domain